MKAKEKCILFLEQNGWKCDIDNPTDEYASYYKSGLHFTVDIDDKELVFIDGNGDFLHTPINYYTLVGVLMEHRQIDCSYASIR